MSPQKKSYLYVAVGAVILVALHNYWFDKSNLVELLFVYLCFIVYYVDKGVWRSLGGLDEIEGKLRDLRLDVQFLTQRLQRLSEKIDALHRPNDH